MENLNFDYDKIDEDYYRNVYKAKNSRGNWHKQKFQFCANVCNSIDAGILDIGTGPGVFLEHFSNNVNLFGYDIAEKQLNAARKVLPNAKFSSNLSEFIKDSEKISHIYCIELIEHIDYEELCKIIRYISTIIKRRKALGKKTIIFITTPNYRSMWPILEIAVDVITKMNYRVQHISKFHPKSLQDTLTNIFLANDLKEFDLKVGTFMGFSWLSSKLTFLDKLMTRYNLGHLCYAKIQI